MSQSAEKPINVNIKDIAEVAALRSKHLITGSGNKGNRKTRRANKKVIEQSTKLNQHQINNLTEF